jgi:hypothetical protein
MTAFRRYPDFRGFRAKARNFFSVFLSNALLGGFGGENFFISQPYLLGLLLPETA